MDYKERNRLRHSILLIMKESDMKKLFGLVCIRHGLQPEIQARFDMYGFTIIKEHWNIVSEEIREILLDIYINSL